MKDPERFDRKKRRGQNLLGYALQEVYNELKGVDEMVDRGVIP